MVNLSDNLFRLEVEKRAFEAYQMRNKDYRLAAMEDQAEDEFRFHLSYFIESIVFDHPSIYTEFIKWYIPVFQTRGLPIDHIQAQQQAIFSVFNYLDDFNLKNASQNLILVTQNLFEFRINLENSYFTHENPLQQQATHYLNLLLSGKRKEANNFILQLNSRGISIKELYLNIFQPSQYEIGRLWQLNEISVAQEHYCTAATQWIISSLYPYLFSTSKMNKSVVAVTIGGELHEMGIRMVADFFEMNGWHSYYLGSNLPADEIKQSLILYNADLLAISITLSNHLHNLKDLIESIKKSSELSHIKIIIGGYPFTQDDQLWSKTGADGYAKNADQAVSLANTLTHASY